MTFWLVTRSTIWKKKKKISSLSKKNIKKDDLGEGWTHDLAINSRTP